MLKHFLIVIRNMLSCLNPFSLFIWTEPINTEAFFHWQLKLELVTFFTVSHFLCTQRHVWATRTYIHTHMKGQTLPYVHKYICTHTEHIVFLQKLVTALCDLLWTLKPVQNYKSSEAFPALLVWQG